jgi:hypothetical protein
MCLPGYPIAWFQVADPRADTLHDTAEFVPNDEGNFHFFIKRFVSDRLYFKILTVK